MNQIHERDWAADDYWGGHTGMSYNLYGDELNNYQSEISEKAKQKEDTQSASEDTKKQKCGQTKKML
jgi:hypothetical protein